MIWLVRSILAFIALAILLTLEWHRPELLNRVDEAIRDEFTLQTATKSLEDRLIVVDIGDKSLNEIGSWPWSRDKIADIVEILLTDYGARAIGVDIVFTTPPNNNSDLRLAALSAHGPICISQIFDYIDRDQPLRAGVLAGGLSTESNIQGLEATGFIANHRGFSESPCVGNIGYIPDVDGVLRRIPILTKYDDKAYNSLAESLLNYSLNQGKDFKAKISNITDENILRSGQWRIPYQHAQSAYTVVEASDILEGRAPASLILGRWVIVGSSSITLGDIISTPLSPLTSGYMSHAAQLSALLDVMDGKIQPISSGRFLLLSWYLFSIVFFLYFLSRLSALKSLLLLLSFIIAWVLLALMGVTWQLEWSLTAPIWSYLFLLGTVIPFEWRQSQNNNKRLMSSFSHYLDKPVLDEIVRRKLKHSLDPTLCKITVLIADMSDYTRLTSSMSLDDAASVTKKFLEILTRPVIKWGGTIDRYSGDGLIAFWGAPLPCNEQADFAVSAAVDIFLDLKAFNLEQKNLGLTSTNARVGIESGWALVGDLGTQYRSTYTAVGDCINFASRLEAAAKWLNVPLIIGPVANSMIMKHSTLSLGAIKLKGIDKKIDIYTVEF